MKVIINVSRFLVGVLFIFSGLVKANDPLGLSYKMQEFFEIWTTGLSNGSFFLNNFIVRMLEFFHEHSLALSVIIIAFEIIAGAALLFGWRMKLLSWLLLLLIIFFTFLTGYAFLSGKFKNCGCFGDCIPITSKTSFIKDLILLLLIALLFAKRKMIKLFLSDSATLFIILVITVLSFGIQWYTLNYLPFADCLPFKKGNNITEKMKLPAGARPDSFAIRFVYEKGGKQFEFSPTELPDDLG
ncbi:MAG: DoxX family membrane protein, partial [Bacteroidia bacterium]|nr:DoxX family membrane protein [Bacteroidia bacterium]